YIISTPWREGDGQLTFRKGYIRRDEDVHRGFLSYTQSNLAHQAFKMLNHPYGWGDKLGGRDCSRFIMDLFRTFGILMPRNSREQARVGVDLGGVKGNSSREKRKVLDQAIPLATTLRLPGHIMLYLGRDKGKHYVIHSLWGIQGSGKVETIGKVVVSDLTLGSNGPNGSLLDRITGMRTIGLSHQIQKEK
ncbi:MAG: C40 family peptidase, partial [Thermodesulfobacteriota bacterium]